uniref:Uncharacterized protein n=1 Tax=Arundo donax TaxID=35708 RepID=A0A0A9ET90_ARUDO
MSEGVGQGWLPDLRTGRQRGDKRLEMVLA